MMKQEYGNRAVSYTHLDVYKRQLLTCVCVCVCDRLCLIDLFCSFTVLFMVKRIKTEDF